MRKINLKIVATAVIIFLCCYALITNFLRATPYTNNGEFSFRGITMGSTYSVTIAEDHNLPIFEIKEEITRILKNLEDIFSLWKKDSELSKINLAPVNTSIKVSNELAEVYNKSSQFYKISDGLFEPTILPLLNLWGFGPSGENKYPTDDEILRVAKKIDFLSFKLSDNSLMKTNPEAKLDFSAVIPGYAADKIAELLEKHNIHNYLINIGGEMRINGVSANKTPWIIGIEDPLNPAGSDERIIKNININSGGLATSGTYRKFKESGSKKLHHIINPKTYRPATSDIVSITVYAPTAFEADALSTFLLIMGSKDSLIWLNKHPQYSAFIIKTEGSTVNSESFERLF